jgi:hypothetical protein
MLQHPLNSRQADIVGATCVFADDADFVVGF